MSQCLCHSLCFISSHRHFITLHHHRGEYSPIRYLERDHLHVAFITEYYNFSILLIVVSLLLCLIYKLNFIIFMYRKKHVQGLVLSMASGIHQGSWNQSPADKGGGGDFCYQFLLMKEAVIDFSLLEGKTVIFTINEIMDVKLLSTMPSTYQAPSKCYYCHFMVRLQANQILNLCSLNTRGWAVGVFLEKCDSVLCCLWNA